MSLVTFRDAADYITSLPEKETDLPDWQVAIEALMLVSQGGTTMLVRIAVMPAVLARPSHQLGVIVKQFTFEKCEQA